VNGISKASGSVAHSGGGPGISTTINFGDLQSAFGGSLKICDIYIRDTTGSYANTNFGNGKVILLTPNAAGRVTNFTPVGQPANWQNAAEIPPQGDSDYNYSAAVGAEDCYKLSAPGTNATVGGVQVFASARMDTVNPRGIELGIGNGTTENFGSPYGLTQTYAGYTSQFSNNPFTGVGWFNVDLTTLQAAVEVYS
jgi:hypothetical protein